MQGQESLLQWGQRYCEKCIVLFPCVVLPYVVLPQNWKDKGEEHRVQLSAVQELISAPAEEGEGHEEQRYGHGQVWEEE